MFKNASCAKNENQISWMGWWDPRLGTCSPIFIFNILVGNGWNIFVDRCSVNWPWLYLNCFQGKTWKNKKDENLENASTTVGSWRLSSERGNTMHCIVEVERANTMHCNTIILYYCNTIVLYCWTNLGKVGHRATYYSGCWNNSDYLACSDGSIFDRPGCGVEWQKHNATNHICANQWWQVDIRTWLSNGMASHGDNENNATMIYMQRM